MSKPMANLPDCTNRCQSTQHGDALTAAITKRCVSDSDLCAYFTHTCCSCESVWDSNGRTTLHVAASCGRTDLVRWLVDNRHANINVKDKESGYTALHRSIFYGKIDTTVELIKLGVNVSLQDSNGLTFLEHAMFDRFRSVPKPLVGGELFAWGPNSNNSLGSQHPRSVPETMDIFHREYPNENVWQILINQFHSVIVTESGTVYSCGHGQGGRLGLGSQKTEVIPKLIKFPAAPNVPRGDERVQIISCSIARDHSLFLASSDELYSCGLNKHRVLGIVPPPAELLTPKILKQLPDSSFVATGNYHSVFWNKSGVYTWGLNAGQLGHQLINAADDTYILTPKRVTCISAKENSLKLVCASTGATVVYTEKGDVYVLHEYQYRKIASRQLNLVEITVIGGKLNHVLDPELSDKNRELKVAALTNNGNLLYWQETDPVLRRCVFSINRALNIKQIALNINQVLLVTNDGEAFKGETKPRKKKQPVMIAEKAKNTTKKSEFHKFLEKDECVSVKLERIPRIHRAVCIQSDPVGQNFGIVQGETSKITMPYAKGVVEALLEFLYTDSLDRLEDRDVDQLFKIIILADQFFVTRLKDQCENILSELLTIKNATQLLTFADTYNADRLKEHCFEFIQQNMTSFLELRLLDDVEPDVLKELSEFYQIKRGLDCRVITPYSTAVSDEEIARIRATCPVDITEKKEKQKIAASKKRVRTHKSSASEKVLSRSLENDSSLRSVSFSSDIMQEADISTDISPIATRVGAIVLAKETLSNMTEIEENFTPLKKKSDSESLSGSFVEFPPLCSPPKPSGFYNRAPHRAKTRTKFTKVPLDVADSPPTLLAESPKNPWKITVDPVSPANSLQNDNIGTIIWSEKRQKENLVKITNKQLAFTQLEDKAMDELRKFYSVDQMEEEVIVIERVSVGAVALPTWVPK